MMKGSASGICEEVLNAKQTVLVKRVFAFLTDHFILCLSIIIPIFLFHNNLEDIFGFRVIAIALTVGFSMYLFKDVFKGRSIGKLVFGLYVKDYSNTKNTPSIFRLILRNLFIVIWPVEFIVMFLSKENRRIGDKISNTQVVGCQKKTLVRDILITAFLPFAMLSLGITQVIRVDHSYKVASEYIESQEEIKHIIGDIKGFGYFPTGNINITNGHGLAELSINVKGEIRNLKLFVTLVKTPQENWQVVNIDYRR